MSAATEDRREKLAEHREVLEAARDAIFGQQDLGAVFADVQGSGDALEALAEVSDVLWGLAADARPHVEVGENELPYATVKKIAPMKRKVAHAIYEHTDALERVYRAMMDRVCDLERANQKLAAALAGYGEDVEFPILEALKELDVGNEVSEVDQ